MKHVTSKAERDKQVIEAIVRRFGPVSRVQIHQLTHLRPTTITNLVRQLLREGKLVEAGPAANPTGRKQTLLRLNTDHGFVVALEFDEEAVVAGVLDVQLRVREVLTEPTELGRGQEGLLNQLKACARKVMAKSKLAPKQVVGMGIADPGLVDSRRGITAFSSTIEFWKQVPLKRAFEAEFKVPVLVESKTRAKTVAERMLGAGNKLENLVYIDYGVGIGAGIVVDGRLLYGQGCAVGEFGHTHVTEGGPACQCGSLGCLEAVVGTRAVLAKIRQALAEGAHSQVLAMANGDPRNLTAGMVLKAAKAGDKICSHIVTELANYLGLGIANLVNLFNPGMVILDKRLELAGDLLRDQILQVVKQQALSNAVEGLSVTFGTVENEPGLLGIGLLVLDRHFEIPALSPPRFMIEPVQLTPAGASPSVSASSAASGSSKGSQVA
jgi:predicted NBD/HSP70 family sugar kinase